MNGLRDELASLKANRAELPIWKEELARAQQDLQKAAGNAESTTAELARARAQAAQLLRVQQELSELKKSYQALATETKPRPQSQSPGDQTTVDADTPNQAVLPPGVSDLGLVEFSPDETIKLDFGGGKESIVTTTLLPDGNLETSFASETMIDGVPVQSSQKLTLTPGRRMMGSVHGVPISLVPSVRSE